MLGFTYDSKRNNKNTYQLQFEDQFQPIIISNAGNGKQRQMPQPIKSKKKLVVTHSKNKQKKSIQRTQKPIQTATNKWNQNMTWNVEPTRQKVGLFDNNIRKDSLAAQERQYRAQSRIKENPKFKQKQRQQKNNNLLTKEQEIHRKKIQVAAQEQQRQIQRLKQLIQKQKKQKQKNDLQFEVKKRKIQTERNKLLQIEKQIQRQGPKAVKQMRQKIAQVHQVPDRIKLKESLNQEDPRKQAIHKNYQYGELTQSQSLANQKNKIRQQQLQYLVDQRQRNYKQYQKNTLGYTPTLIPLLSRASYKIISTQISSLVQLFIDDLLEEQVYLLQAIELETKAELQKQKQKQIFKDYVDKLQDFVDQAQNIQNRIGQYSKMQFKDIYKHPSQILNGNTQRPGFQYALSNYAKLQLNLTGDQVEQVEHRVERYKRYVNAFDEYKPAYLQLFKKVTQQVINQAIQKLAKQLDNGAGQFVSIVFRSQFD